MVNIGTVCLLKVCYLSSNCCSELESCDLHPGGERESTVSSDAQVNEVMVIDDKTTKVNSVKFHELSFTLALICLTSVFNIII